MTALEYLDSLILGQEMSSFPIQISELKMLRHFMVNPPIVPPRKEDK